MDVVMEDTVDNRNSSNNNSSSGSSSNSVYQLAGMYNISPDVILPKLTSPSPLSTAPMIGSFHLLNPAGRSHSLLQRSNDKLISAIMESRACNVSMGSHLSEISSLVKDYLKFRRMLLDEDNGSHKQNSKWVVWECNQPDTTAQSIKQNRSHSSHCNGIHCTSSSSSPSSSSLHYGDSHKLGSRPVTPERIMQFLLMEMRYSEYLRRKFQCVICRRTGTQYYQLQCGHLCCDQCNRCIPIKCPIDGIKFTRPPVITYT
jgi:hypothetical protein